MSNVFRRSFVAGLLLYVLASLPGSIAMGQTSAPVTPLDKVLGRIDFAISANGIISTAVSGIEQRDASGSTYSTTSGTVTTTTTTTPVKLAIDPSSTVGEVVTLRYTARPWVGFEFNFGNSRYTQNYIFTGTATVTTTNNASKPPTVTTTTSPVPQYLSGGAQSGAHEETLGWVVHPPHTLLGLQPFAGVGAGTIRFKPTAGGGEGLPQQYRAAYYYEAGLEDYFPTTHLGVRASFRQLLYLAPDFGQNYLTITRRTLLTEPTFGFFLRF